MPFGNLAIFSQTNLGPHFAAAIKGFLVWEGLSRSKFRDLVYMADPDSVLGSRGFADTIYT